ncbi:30S ribosomal protein S7 [bacterium]|jgi:small subunit ribosomal protein S7|nr:30S ribosomal protein S7 [bacterium]MBP9808821.1 30S ribosomal protein S7 [bacterium]MDP3508132.1 30S ribosomal protein S7 [Candidatus Melainabacteria bacterium]MDQ5933193.1 small subunit ribosomal protein [Cyanobacteriota bacterium erpe_2018_sw_21hr_WHONDRS-SW48-000092_B_bin.40]
MSRRKQADKRITVADPVFNSQQVSRFVNRMMQRGKRSTAQSLFYDALQILKDRTKQEPLDVFNKALKNVTPLVEVKARRVGGSTYQVPVEVKSSRGFALASQWLIANSRKRPGRTFAERLSAELADASNGTGASVKKRDETHKMAEANKAFAHYRY